MYQKLKKLLWKAVDKQLIDELFVKPKTKSLARRLYVRNHDGNLAQIVDCRFMDVAGGKFWFGVGVTSGPLPEELDQPLLTDGFVFRNGFRFASTEYFGFADALIEVELTDQRIPKKVIEAVLAKRSEYPAIANIDSTPYDVVNFAAFEVAEAIGIAIQDDWLMDIATKFELTLSSLVSGSLRPSLARLKDLPL